MIQSPCVPDMDFWQDPTYVLPSMNLILRHVWAQFGLGTWAEGASSSPLCYFPDLKWPNGAAIGPLKKTRAH